MTITAQDQINYKRRLTKLIDREYNRFLSQEGHGYYESIEETRDILRILADKLDRALIGD
jgi:hypothetical protein